MRSASRVQASLTVLRMFCLCSLLSFCVSLPRAFSEETEQKLKGFKEQSKFKTWLYRIATNLCINKVTRRKPTTELPETLIGPETEEPEAEYRRRQKEQVVRAAIDCLPSEQRSALMLSVYENMRYSEIAVAMGKSVRAVDSLLFRAKTNLRKNLAVARRKGIV